MIYNYYDSYGYKFPEGFITTATQRGVKFLPSKNIPQKRTEIESFFGESGQGVGDLNQSPLLYKNKIECDEPITKHDYSKDYLTFEALEYGTFSFTRNALQYSLDNGTTWTTLPAGHSSPFITAGNKILWKQTGLTPNSSYGIGTFSSMGNFNVSGNIMSLLYGDDFVGQLTLQNYSFYRLFAENRYMVSAKDMILPATTLAEHCYEGMFYHCTSLTTAPELPATTLTESCYGFMFSGCIRLNYIKALFTTTPSNSYTKNWVEDVAANGTFVKSTDATWSVVGTNGVPTGWSIENA